jgi:Flp pilus assembly protein TadD
LQSASDKKKPSIAQAAHFYLGKAHLQLGQVADAENEFRTAAAISGRLTSESNAVLQRLEAIRSAPDNK